jgi:hypothetical protein
VRERARILPGSSPAYDGFERLCPAAKALCSYMGHSSITVTLDRYGHLMPGDEAQAAGMLASYLEREPAL